MAVREICRNPNCGMKLKRPTENAHHAFCTVGCYEQFFRHRCVVCECRMERVESVWNKQTCGRRECRKTLRNSGDAYRPPSRWSGYVERYGRNAHGMGVKIPWRERPRVWRVAAGNLVSHANLIMPLHAETERRANQALPPALKRVLGASAAYDRLQSGFAISRWRPTGDGKDVPDVPAFLRR
jgi:hypothetical protein